MFLLACQNNPKEIANVPTSKIVPKDYSSDSTAKWTRNVFDYFSTMGFVDKNNLKQGKWTSWENGKVIKVEIYKDGELLKDC